LLAEIETLADGCDETLLEEECDELPEAEGTLDCDDEELNDVEREPEALPDKDALALLDGTAVGCVDTLADAERLAEREREGCVDCDDDAETEDDGRAEFEELLDILADAEAEGAVDCEADDDLDVDALADGCMEAETEEDIEREAEALNEKDGWPDSDEEELKLAEGTVDWLALPESDEDPLDEGCAVGPCDTDCDEERDVERLLDGATERDELALDDVEL
jgi:hypothetical protein